MKIYVSSPQDTPIGRLWCLGDLSYDSLLAGGNRLDDYSGRLVGIDPRTRDTF